MNDIRDLEIESFTNLTQLLKSFSSNTASHKMSSLGKSTPTNVSSVVLLYFDITQFDQRGSYTKLPRQS